MKQTSKWKLNLIEEQDEILDSLNAINENMNTIDQNLGTNSELPIASSTVLGGIKVGSNLIIEADGTLNATSGGESGTTDYTNLLNKPKINDIELDGNKTSDELGLQSKLTAGDNITIFEDGTINAVGSGATILSFENFIVNVEEWVVDTTYEQFGYRADIACKDVTSSFFSNVAFGVKEAISGNYAPISVTGEGTVTIYAVEAPTEAITIPTIICSKGS